MNFINQRITGQLVDREVIHCCSEMISECQNIEKYNNEIAELFYCHQDFEQGKENYLYTLTPEEKAELLLHYDVSSIEEIEDQELCDDKEVEAPYKEPYEFWIVTEYLGEKLKEEGEIVEEFFGFTIWGRCTTGQAISIDGVIFRIARKMEILEGQKNEWRYQFRD